MRRLLLPVLLLVLLAVPAVAQASYQDVIKDCLDPAHNEQLTKTYTNEEYKQALKHLPNDAKEYTGCYDVIASAQRNVASGGTGTGATGGSDGSAGTGGGAGTTGGTGGTGTGTGTGGGATAAPAATGAGDPLAVAAPADQAAATQAAQVGRAPVQVGAAMITPGDPGTTASSLSDLPTPLLIVLALAALAALAGLALYIKSLVLRRTSP